MKKTTTKKIEKDTTCKHSCCSCSWSGGLLWTAAVVCLILAWFASSRGSVWSIEASTWYINALVLGILSIPAKLKAGCGTICEGKMCKSLK